MVLCENHNRRHKAKKKDLKSSHNYDKNATRIKHFLFFSRLNCVLANKIGISVLHLWKKKDTCEMCSLRLVHQSRVIENQQFGWPFHIQIFEMSVWVLSGLSQHNVKQHTVHDRRQSTPAKTTVVNSLDCLRICLSMK